MTQEQKSVEECILSNNDIQRNGYDRIYYKGKNWLAHRLIMHFKHGRIPKGKLVLHKCNVRNCINPRHLYFGNYKDNSVDCWNSGRHIYQTNPEIVPHGSRHSKAKLKESDIPEIFRLRKAGKQYAEIAKKYNVFKTTIGCVIRRRYWKHVKI